jgi:nitrite reductase/ring-hydroxylating ferredoxin subunit
MTEPSSLTRRALLTAGGAAVVGAGTLVLAACSSPAPGGAGTGAGTAPKAASGTEVAKLADVPVGGTASAKIGGDPVLLAQPTAGTVVCFSAVCPHLGCFVGAAPTEFDCPCHGSRFNAQTGDAIVTT